MPACAVGSPGTTSFSLETDFGSGPVSTSGSGSGQATGETPTVPNETTTDGSGDSGATPACTEIDTPDAHGLDENDDGIDGVVCRAVFVNADGGSDLNDGLESDDPVATIAHAIDVAQTYVPRRMVLVAAGVYPEIVNLAPGVSLYGGYDPVTWDRDHLHHITTIEGPGDRTLVAQNLDQAVEVDGFLISGPTVADDSTSTYAVWVADTPEGLLTIDDCTIASGDAGRGADGDHGIDGADGVDGTPGGNSVGVGGSPGQGGDSVCDAVGGNGGAGSSCPSTAGQAGSPGIDATPAGQGGPAGASECQGNTCGDQGSPGTAGQPGNTGSNGQAATTATTNRGQFDGTGRWVAPSGESAAPGHNGSGGGGGGAGGYDVDSGLLCLLADGIGTGGGGGGGGAGGCGGGAGESGRPGGGSFGLVAWNSSVSVSNTDIRLGRGGNGGDGGSGADGGLPGDSGPGGRHLNLGGEAGDGADGARGGGGGGGSGGSGGCGGASVGIAIVGRSVVATDNVAFLAGVAGTPGSGGSGGFRTDGNARVQAPPGPNGCPGLRTDQVTYPD